MEKREMLQKEASLFSRHYCQSGWITWDIYPF